VVEPTYSLTPFLVLEQVVGKQGCKLALPKGQAITLDAKFPPGMKWSAEQSWLVFLICHLRRTAE
jgi:hypothetical protein